MHWDAFINIAIAVGLSLIIGAEREYFSKSAGMRTTTLVGLGSSVFTVVSREGLWLAEGMATTAADGSRVAAQIVSGVGFLGAGLIFVRRDSVRGLTTAAGIWFAAAIGMAAGAGLPWIALFSTAVYMIATVGIRPISRRMPHSKRAARAMKVTYEDGHGILRQIMEAIGDRGIVVLNLEVLGGGKAEPDDSQPEGVRVYQTVTMDVRGQAVSLEELAHHLMSLTGVRHVEWQTRDDEGD